jgi:hypothetical protein
MSFTLGKVVFEQLLSSCNDVSCADMDRHDDGYPNDLSDPRQHQEPTEEQNKQQYADLNLRSL